MIARLLWFAGVFGLSVWIGAHWDAAAVAVRPFDPTALASVVERPFHTLTDVFQR